MNNLLTADVLAKEFIFQLEVRACPSGDTLIPLTEISHRKCVSWPWCAKDLELSIDDYIVKHIAPAAIAMIDAIRQEGGTPMFANLELPDLATFKSRADRRGYSARIVADVGKQIVHADVAYKL